MRNVSQMKTEQPKIASCLKEQKIPVWKCGSRVYWPLKKQPSIFQVLDRKQFFAYNPKTVQLPLNSRSFPSKIYQPPFGTTMASRGERHSNPRSNSELSSYSLKPSVWPCNYLLRAISCVILSLPWGRRLHWDFNLRGWNWNLSEDKE